MTAATTFRPTAADRIRWQRRAVDLLNEVWAKGAKAGLQPLMWQIGASGISGVASGLLDGNDVAEAQLRAWAQLLGLEVQRADRITTHRRLYASADDYGKARAAVSISVDLWDED